MKREEWVNAVKNYVETHENLKNNPDFKVNFEEGTTYNETSEIWRTEAENKDQCFLFICGMTGKVRLVLAGSKN